MALSASDRCEIGFRAATLYERLTESAPPMAEAAPTADRHPAGGDLGAAAILQAWQQAFASGDRRAFERRLEWDDLDPDEIASALDAGPRSSDPPVWTAWLDAFGTHAVASAHAASTIAGTSTSDEPPFIELWLPLVRATRDALAQRLSPRTLGARLWDALERQWLTEFAGLGALAAHDAFARFAESSTSEGTTTHEPAAAAGDAALRGSSARYDAFVAGTLSDGMASFFRTCPVLARQLAHAAACAVDAAHELFVRLDRDRADIASHFANGVDPGAVVSLTPGLSDPHHGRRRVAIVELASGLRLVYKPRDVGLEQAYNQFLEWAVRNGLSPAPPIVDVLSRDGYGWMTCVAHEPCRSVDEVHEYYRVAGGLLCLAWLLGGRDLHQENVIATRRGPVLVDVEMLLQPSGSRLVEAPAQSAMEAAEASHPRESALDTALLTLVQISGDGHAAEIGGLRGGASEPPLLRRRIWTGLRSDAIGFHDDERPAPPDANRVLLDGEVQSPEAYADDMTVGFTSTYRFLQTRRDLLLAPDGPLSIFAGRHVRVVFRPSDAYATLHQALAAPRFLQHGVLRSCAMDAINRAFNTERARPLVWPLVGEERRALDAVDIPRFTVRTDDTIVDQGREAGPVFAESGLAAVRARVRTLSVDDLSRQLDVLADALADPLAPLRSAPPVDARDAEVPRGAAKSAVHASARAPAFWLDHARWIGQELLARAIAGRGLDGRPNLTWTLNRFRREVSGLTKDTPALYDGALGPALFFAALHTVTGDAEWADTSRATARPVLDWLASDAAQPASESASSSIGAARGIGSLMLGLLWTGRLLADDECVTAARQASERLSPARIDSDRALDLAGGTAGALLAALALLDDGDGDSGGDGGGDDARLTALAVHAGDRLLATQVECDEGAAWPARDGGIHAGFAHGAAGIAYALVRLHERVARPEYLRAAQRAFRFVRSRYAPTRRNWPVLPGPHARAASVPIWMTAWCHGAPGIALAYGLTLDRIGDEAARDDLCAAIRTTAERRATPAEHVCCGNLGRAEILLTLGHRLHAPSLVAAAEEVAGAALDRARRRGHFTLNTSGVGYRVFDPGFFQGLSGIGYQLLRFAAPEALPSILAFETARPTRATVPQVTHAHHEHA